METQIQSETEKEDLKTDLISRLNTEWETANNFRLRKSEHWTENYSLYRDVVETNRLEQRQAVNYPLMKESVKTILSEIDEPPLIYFKCLEETDEGADKEIVLNELWNDDYDRLNVEGLDMLDKKQVLITGRSFLKLNFTKQDNGKKRFYTDVVDCWDMLIDPKVKPLNIESAKWIIHQHIFKPLKDILADPKYTKEGKAELREFIDTKAGIIKAEEAEESLEQKNERMAELEVDNFDEFAGAETIVELKEHYTYLWDEDKKKFVRYLVIYALDSVELYRKTLKKAIGVDFWPFVSWADDVDISDFWSDSLGDMVRVPNKIINIYLSQWLENRTHRNYGAHWFDATNPDFQPTSYTLEPWGMYPAPGNPNQVVKQIEFPDLSGSPQDIEFVRGIVERATAASAIKKGAPEKGQMTLGEIQLLDARASERIISMSKAYRRCRKELGQKWLGIVDANTSNAEIIELYKESQTGKTYKKEIKASDWKSEAGYKVKVMSTSEQDRDKLEAVNKWITLKKNFPENLALQKIADRRILQNMDVSPDELREIEEFNKQQMAMRLNPPAPPEAMTPAQGGGEEELTRGLQEKMGQFQSMAMRT